MPNLSVERNHLPVTSYLPELDSTLAEQITHQNATLQTPLHYPTASELVTTLISSLLLIKLIQFNHPRAKHYVEEVCQDFHASEFLDECHAHLLKSLAHHGRDDGSLAAIADDLTQGEESQKVTEIARTFCQTLKAGYDHCNSLLSQELGRLREAFQRWESARPHAVAKRGACQAKKMMKNARARVSLSKEFSARHIISAADEAKVLKHGNWVSLYSDECFIMLNCIGSPLAI